MGLFLDYENTDLWARMLTDFTDFLYYFLLEVAGYTLTLGFASCLRDSTDKKHAHIFAVMGTSKPYAREVG